MRWTIKAKLAAAFGTVIILTIVVGGVGYSNLLSLNATIEDLVSKRMEMRRLSLDLSIHTLQGIRAEKNAIISIDETEMAGLARKILSERAVAHDDLAKLKQIGDASTLDLTNKIEAAIVKYEPVQDKTVAFTMLNSNFRAHDATMKLLPSYGTTLAALTTMIEANQDAAVTRVLTSFRGNLYRLWSDAQIAIAAGSMDELANINKQIEADRAEVSKALAQATTALHDKAVAGGDTRWPPSRHS